MKRTVLLFLLTALAMAVATPVATAAFGLNEFEVAFTRADGTPEQQAGSHPYEMTISFGVNTEEPQGKPIPIGSIKDLISTQTAGLVADRSAVPPCSTLDFLRLRPGQTIVPECADSSAVGITGVEIGELGEKGTIIAPVYSLEPPPGVVAKLGFWAQSVPVTIDIGVDDASPYNGVATLRNISQVLEVFGTEFFTLWGNPSDPRHDEERGACYKGFETGKACSAGISGTPFLTLPRSCEGPLETAYEVDSWQNPGVWVGETGIESPGMIGCGKLGFAPKVSVQPSTTSAESSSGLDIAVEVNDEGLKNPEGFAQADIEAILTALPVGVTANPSAAEGLGVCSKAQYEAEALGTPSGQGCPDAAKLGSVEAESPLLENHTLRGSLYLAEQDDPATSTPEAENPFDSLLAFYLVIRDPALGIFVKQAGEVEPDLRTGQLVSLFDELPPFPLSRVGVKLRSGPRAPLITPSACGTYTTEMELFPSSGAEPLLATSSFKIDSGVGGGRCPSGAPPFNPGFEAGSANNAAGAFSPFNLRLTRADGEQDLTRFSAVLPPGVVGKIAGVAKCSDQQIAAAKQKSGRQEQGLPSCPATAQLGRVLAGAGVGSALTYVPGKLYLAGPYNGRPLSVVAIVPAVAGPFDAGTVVTRVALNLNRDTAEVEVDGAGSDPIPHILKGIPLKVRDIRVFADRPNFTINPTNCEPSLARATIFGSFLDVFSSADDVALARSTRYQASSCASLAFKPKLSLALKGGTRRGDHPALRAILTPRAGDANIGRSAVTLPPSEFIDNAHIQNPCTRVQFSASQCPKGSVLGTAQAFSPLLEEPLEGPIYFRSNGGERQLPDVVADLHGLFNVVVVGFVDSRKGRIRTTFASPPDAPVSKFVFLLKGGKRGLLVNSRSLCKGKLRATVNLTGQNGRPHNTRPVMATGCKKPGKKAKRAARG